MATQPTSVEIRTYQVGFGDCFLLSFLYAKARRHVLIDFGSTGITESRRKRPPKGRVVSKAKAGTSISAHMRKIADDIAAVCGKDGLTALVATHRR